MGNINVILKKRSGDPLYPRVSLDNLVASAGAIDTVQVPTLNTSGVIDSTFFPDSVCLLDSTGHIDSKYLSN